MSTPSSKLHRDNRFTSIDYLIRQRNQHTKRSKVEVKLNLPSNNFDIRKLPDNSFRETLKRYIEHEVEFIKTIQDQYENLKLAFSESWYDKELPRLLYTLKEIMHFCRKELSGPLSKCDNLSKVLEEYFGYIKVVMNNKDKIYAGYGKLQDPSDIDRVLKFQTRFVDDINEILGKYLKNYAQYKRYEGKHTPYLLILFYCHPALIN